VFTGVHLDNVTAPDEIVFRTVTAAVDLGPQTRAVVRWAHGFASACGAELHLLHAVPSVPDDAWRKRIAAIAREDLAAYAAGNGEIRQNIEVVSGQFPAAICTTVEAVGADLLVIGRGHGTAGGRIRSHVLSIVRESPCPVVSV
jgi:nucleotide-binding universal stress UspA family protein